MARPNNLRAQLLYETFYKNQNQTNVALTFDGMIDKLLTIPSYVEKECCTGKTKNWPVIKLNNEVFNNDFANLAQAIEENFVENSTCSRCGKGPTFTRTFGNHAFIDVR